MTPSVPTDAARANDAWRRNLIAMFGYEEVLGGKEVERQRRDRWRGNGLRERGDLVLSGQDMAFRVQRRERISARRLRRDILRG